MADNPGVKGVLIHKLEVERFDKESLALKVSLVVKVGMSAIQSCHYKCNLYQIENIPSLFYYLVSFVL